jgi:23S rRNA pseudouridine1911/1915/1917 synthase
VNGQKQKAKYAVKEGEIIRVDYEPAAVPEISLPIIYEDEDCMVIDKPAGVLTHSKGSFNPEGTVASFIRDKIDDELTGERAGIVHRLDRATSGVMICAKTAAAQKWLQKQFSSRKVKKTYLLAVEGHLKQQHAIIDMPIQRNPRNPKTFATGTLGKPAQTEYQVIRALQAGDFIEAKPKTGRTHQLRVHFAKLGHPIIGDTFYKGKAAQRLLLHASSLELTLPNRERKVFTMDLPDDFRSALDG